ncbi:MAG TPA: hypothetical protein VH477_06720 [Bryobacteraceae bacterium]|jgi:hypothetical protein
MFWERIVVKTHERLLLIRNGRFDRILVPGEYRIGVMRSQSLAAERHDVRNLVFRSTWADYLVRERADVMERYFTRVDTTETEVAMVYVNGELFRVLAPVKRLLLWRGIAEVTAEVVSVVAETAEALALRK